MTEDKGILIRNIYYMLAYAFQTLRQNNFTSIASEDFDDIYELFAEILTRGVSYQLKQGLHKEYISKQDDIKTVRGKININETMRLIASNRQMLNCEYDELSENCLFNQIIKTTLEKLLQVDDFRKSKKAELRKKIRQCLIYFGNVDTIDHNQIQWSAIRYDRNSKNYQMLLNICYFVLQNIVMSSTEGKYKMREFSDDNMNRLYEKFILEYYRRHHPELEANNSNVRWDIDEKQSSMDIIPNMFTDITLLLTNGRILIIDAKYYSKTLSENMGKKRIHTNNLYQIYAYVMNADKAVPGKVDGMLLYAKTQETIVPDGKQVFNTGNTIYFKTLDLNQPFDGIKKQLEELIK